MKETFLHFLTHKKWLIGYSLFCIIFALFVSVFAREAGLRGFARISSAQENKLVGYLEKEEQYILRTVSQLEQRTDVQNYALTKNVPGILAILKEQQAATGLTAFTVTDGKGIALSRSLPGAPTGDNVFLLLAAGRLAAKGLSGFVVGAGRNFPLTMGGVFPIKGPEGDIKGAVIGGYWLDNSYAKQFKKMYLSHWYHQEVVFYSKESGVTGSSIEDLQIRKAMRAYINHGALLIQEKRSGTLLNFGGKDYVISNHLFSGKEDVPGGTLLLTQLPLTLFWRSLFISFFITLLFLASTLLVEHVSVPTLFKPRRKNLLTLLSILSFMVWGSVWFGIYLNGKKAITYIDAPLFSIYNSTMSIEPSSGIYVKGYPQQASVVVYSGGENINAIEVHLRFDPKLTRVDTLSFERSVCADGQILQQDINNKDGYVIVSCVITGDAFADAKEVVVDLTMTPLTTGEVVLSFDDGTQVLAADGLGTDVLRAVTAGDYRIFLEEEMGGVFSPKAVAIPYSYTHENSSKWYNNRHIRIVWPRVDGAEYVYELSDVASSTFINPSVTSSDHVSLDAPYDGVFYFRIAPRKSGVQGSVSSLKIKIDTTPPDIPTIRASSLSVKRGEVVRLELSSKDDLSGLEKNFYVQNDGSIWLPTFSKLYIPFHDVGEHSIGVRVFDNAGNYADTSVVVQVKK